MRFGQPIAEYPTGFIHNIHSGCVEANTSLTLNSGTPLTHHGMQERGSLTSAERSETGKAAGLAAGVCYARTRRMQDRPFGSPRRRLQRVLSVNAATEHRADVTVALITRELVR
jgi:hypothetical protein